MSVFIIAEAGVNHNGSRVLARKLIDAAAAAGADAVKFQTFSADRIVSRFAPKAEYQKKVTDAGESQLDMIRKLELSFDTHRELAAYCRKKKIMFLSSPFDCESVDLLRRLGLMLFKIPSGEITNLPLLRKIGALGRRVILSTGMSDLEEVKTALSVLVKAGTPKDNITVLQCNTEYPTPVEDANVRAMDTIRNVLGVKTGYSDHSEGIAVPVAAAALGAVVIEKHITLDRALPGPDHRVSLDPEGFRAMVKAIRDVEKALGDGRKKPASSEMRNRDIVRKSIVAATDIKKGTRFTGRNIVVKRPGNGISPMRWDEVIGKRAVRDFRKDEMISV
jgi:N,N'-diacetyllegionaminate synthase